MSRSRDLIRHLKVSPGLAACGSWITPFTTATTTAGVSCPDCRDSWQFYAAERGIPGFAANYGERNT